MLVCVYLELRWRSESEIEQSHERIRSQSVKQESRIQNRRIEANVPDLRFCFESNHIFTSYTVPMCEELCRN